MIQLDLHEYCQQCRDFDAVTEKNVLFADGSVMETTFTVRCRNKAHCEALVRHLKEFAEKEN